MLAFGIDAWWDERQERAEEIDLLEGLRDELRFNLARLDEFDESLQQSTRAVDELLALSVPNARPVDAAAVDSLLFAAIAWGTYDPSSGAIQEILKGRLAIIRSEGLRREIARWDEQRRDFREDEEFAEIEFRDHFWPYLRTRALVFARDRAARSPVFGQPRHHMLRETEFANFIGMWSGRVGMLARESRDFRAYLEAMSALVDERLPAG